MQPWAFVTPASRGIGMALTRRILQTTNVPVVATARKSLDQVKEDILRDLDGIDGSRLTILNLDVLDESTIEAASSYCKDQFPTSSHHLHHAFIVPGVLFPEKSPDQIKASEALLTFQTNTLGPLLLIKHFHRFLPTKRTSLPFSDKDKSSDAQSESWKGLNPSRAIWATMSARVGSISDNRLGGWYSYRASKAAINQTVRTFDNHLRASAADKAVAIALHPGTVRTRLSSDFWSSVAPEKLFEPDWVAERLVALCVDGGGIVPEGRGRCWDWDGKEVPP